MRPAIAAGEVAIVAIRARTISACPDSNFNASATCKLATAETTAFSTLAVSNRIQAELLRLASLAPRAGKSARIAPAPTHTDIASRVSTHREAVTRELNRLSRAGLIERAGGVNVAARGALRGGIANVSMEQVIAWAPDTIVTWDANFFASYGTSPLWATVPAVANKRVYLAPRLPFGWIDAPPSINRYIGLRWIARLLYPDRFPEDIRTTAREFFKLFYQSEPDDAALARILAGAQPGGRGR